jgi:hypothetical protein
MAVLRHHLGHMFNGVSHQDVLVLWHTSYYFHGMEQCNKIQSLFMKLRDNDTEGPILQELLDSMAEDLWHPVIQAHHMPFLADRCLNYSSIQCRRALVHITSTPAHLSQETHFKDSNNDFSVDIDCFDEEDCFPSPVRQKDTPETVRGQCLSKACLHLCSKN